MPEQLIPAHAALRSFCTFRLDHRLYGIEVAQVREVSPHLPVTPVPQAPPAVRGLFNLRSRIYLALDLRPLLGLAPTECTVESRLIILKPDLALDVGILVEQGGDIIHAQPGLFESAAALPDGATPMDPESAALIAGVCKLPSELMLVVDLSGIAARIAALFH